MSIPRTDRPWYQQAIHQNPYPDRTCVTCRWWVKNGAGGPTGNCYRRSPQAELHQHPTTLDTSWCGEWEHLLVPRLIISGVEPDATWYWILHGKRSQEFETRGAAIEAEGLGTIEWRDV